MHAQDSKCLAALRRYSPKSLAKPFMVAHQQYVRLYKDIGNPLQDLPAPAGKPADKSLEPTLASTDAHSDAPPVVLPPAPDPAARATARLKAMQDRFDTLRTHCPYVYLTEDGSDVTETPQVRRFLDVGIVMNFLSGLLERVQKDTPSLKNLPLTRT